MPTVSYNLKYLILLVFALCFYSTEVYRPIDGTSKTVWREADGGAIARNFYQEGMNIFYPRIDWRGTGPGFVESELPLEPWLGAALYKTFGYQEWFLRLISMITMLGCCGVFFLLAQSLLNDRTAFLASVIFVIHPFIFLMSTAIQPEPFMLLGYLLAIYGFVRWIQTDQLSFYFLALLATPFAILAKIPAAHVGILFALMSLNKFGIKALFSFKLWAFAIFTLGIPILWYMHARSLWEIYGNSLGISNEAYENIKDYNLTDFIKVQIFGNLSIEFTKVWMFFGTLLAISGFYSFNKKKNGKIIIYWALALIIFYIVCGRTTGAAWAAYYHIVSIPLACLVMAEGYYYLIDRFISSREVRYLANALLFAVICFEVALFFYTEFLKTHQYEEDYLSAKKFEKIIPKNDLIVVSGMSGYPAYYFFWIDRKGFVLQIYEQSLERLNQLKETGAKYFIVEKILIETNPQFYNEVIAKYPIIEETKSTLLFHL